jgi:ABC-type transporter Mla subunit MlaD
MTRKEQERIEQEHYQAQMQFENFESELNAARETINQHADYLSDLIAHAAKDAPEQNLASAYAQLAEVVEAFEESITEKQNTLEELRYEEAKAYRKALEKTENKSKQTV